MSAVVCRPPQPVGERAPEQYPSRSPVADEDGDTEVVRPLVQPLGSFCDSARLV